MDISDPGIEPESPALQADSLPTELRGKPHKLTGPCLTDRSQPEGPPKRPNPNSKIMRVMDLPVRQNKYSGIHTDVGDKQQLFFIVKSPILTAEGMTKIEITISQTHHGINYRRQEPLLDAKINRQKYDKKIEYL